MNPVIFSKRVLKALNGLPERQRNTIASALTSEFLLGASDAITGLSAIERMAYVMIRQYIVTDTARLAI